MFASVVMQSVTADGGTQLSLRYDVLEPISALPIGFYRSSDRMHDSQDLLLDSITLTSAADLSLGNHVKTLTIGTGTDQIILPGAGAMETSDNYSILTVTHVEQGVNSSTAQFSGVYHPRAGGVYIHGGDLTDSISIDSSYRVTWNGRLKQYTASDVSSFRARLHAGDDSLSAATALKSLWVDGGDGRDVVSGSTRNDTILGSNGNDVLTGGGGTDTLHGGRGDDLLNGGIANDVIDGGEGTDVVQFAGTRGTHSVTPSSTITTSVTVVDTATTTDGNEGTDSAALAEVLRFKDVDMSLVVTGNTVPIAVPDNVTTSEGAGGSLIRVLDNDRDPDVGDILRIASIDSTGIRGTLGNTATGTEIAYYPGTVWESLSVGQQGNDSFRYTVRDLTGNQATAEVTVTINGMNDAPIANVDQIIVSEDAAPTLVSVLQNDTDIDAVDTKTVIAVNGDGIPESWELVMIYGVGAPVTIPEVPAIRGTVRVGDGGVGAIYAVGNAYQSLRAGQTAAEKFLYTIADGQGATSTNWVNVTVQGANDAPVAVDDAVTIMRNAGPKSITVLANDTDADTGDVPTIRAFDATGVRGTVTRSTDGNSLLYSPGSAFDDLAPNQHATEVVTYTIADASGAESTASVTVTVLGTENRAPIAFDDVAVAMENGTYVRIDVLGNDQDPDLGDTRSVVSVTSQGTRGQMTIDSGVSVVYSIGAAFQELGAGATATDQFAYSIADSGGAQSTAQVVVTVTGANDAPIAVPDQVSLFEDGGAQSISVLTNDLDIDFGDTRSIVSVDSIGTKGTVQIDTDGISILYTPFESVRAGQTGTDTFRYTISDGHGLRASTSVTVTVIGANDLPMAVDNEIAMTEDAVPTTISVLTNDLDPDVGDTRRVVAVDASGVRGTVTIPTTGNGIIYAPGNAFQHLITGQTVAETFTYTMVDGSGAESSATVTVNISGITDGPAAVADTFTISEGDAPIRIEVLANDTNDLNSTANLTITSIHGTGEFAGITLIMTYGVGVGSFFPGFPRMLGQASVASDGRAILYTPPQSFNGGEVGVDQFKYTITHEGRSSTGIVTINVIGDNDAPDAQDDLFTLSSNASPMLLDVLANDRDPDNRSDVPLQSADEFSWDPTPADLPDMATIVDVQALGLHGGVSIDSTGKKLIYEVRGSLIDLTFGTSVTETFAYTIRDSQGATSTAFASVVVTGTNRAPVAVLDEGSTTEDGGAVWIPVLENDTDVDLSSGDVLQLVSVDTLGNLGSATLDGSAIRYDVGDSFQYLAEGEQATASIRYTIADREGLTAQANVLISVSGVNDAPIAAGDQWSISEDVPVTAINVLVNDIDPDSTDSLFLVALDAAGTIGSVTISTDGRQIIYSVSATHQSLNSGQTAVDTFKYTITDASGSQSTTNVSITIVGANEPVVYVSVPTPQVGDIVGTASDDVVVATAAADVVFAMSGDDELLGGDGNDSLYGGNDDDSLDGGNGNDILHGGAGRDDLTGGAGRDSFVYYLTTESTSLLSDRIRDFDISQGDLIDLSRIDASTTVGGNNDFVLVTSFTGIAGQLTLTTVSSGIYWARGDVNGDGIADLQIEVRSKNPLTAASFSL